MKNSGKEYMRCFVNQLFIIVLLILFSNATPAAPFSSSDKNARLLQPPSPSIIIAYDAIPYPPYSMGNHSLEKPGISIEALRLIGQRLGINFEFVAYPWKRCLENARRNVVDGVVDVSFMAERTKFGVYPMNGNVVNPHKRNHKQVYSFFTLNDSPLGWDGKALHNLGRDTVVATLGYSVVDTLNKLGIKNLHTTSGAKQSLVLLTRGRVAAIADLNATIENAILARAPEYDNVIKLPVPLKEVDYYLLLSHQFFQQNPVLANKIWDEIEKLRNSSEFTALLDKYSRQH